MRWLILILVPLITQSVQACDQQLYDEFYRAIVLRCLNSKMTQEDIDHKNDAIVTLRRLCNGQLSHWETGKRARHE